MPTPTTRSPPARNPAPAAIPPDPRCADGARRRHRIRLAASRPRRRPRGAALCGRRSARERDRTLGATGDIEVRSRSIKRSLWRPFGLRPRTRDFPVTPLRCRKRLPSADAAFRSCSAARISSGWRALPAAGRRSRWAAGVANEDRNRRALRKIPAA